MKKILVALSLLVTVGTASAYEGYYRGGYHSGGCGNCWVAPALVGGLIGYGLARPYYAPQPVYVQQPVIVQQPVYLQQTPVGYHWQMMVDPNTGIQQAVLVPN
jgi:hypothetical protein